MFLCGYCSFDENGHTKFNGFCLINFFSIRR